MSWILSNWQTVVVSVLSVAEVLSLFIKGNGTLAGVIAALRGVPGVKDPKIGE